MSTVHQSICYERLNAHKLHNFRHYKSSATQETLVGSTWGAAERESESNRCSPSLPRSGRWGRRFKSCLHLVERRKFHLDCHVRFTPKSGHWLSVLEDPLSAKSGHQFGLAGNGSSTLYVIIGRRMPLSANSPTGSIVTAFSTACRTRGLMRI